MLMTPMMMILNELTLTWVCITFLPVRVVRLGLKSDSSPCSGALGLGL